MKYAKLADDGKIYNKAFEGYRRQFLKENFTAIAAVIAVAAVGLTVFGRYRKNHGKNTDRKEKEQP